MRPWHSWLGVLPIAAEAPHRMGDPPRTVRALVPERILGPGSVSDQRSHVPAHRRAATRSESAVVRDIGCNRPAIRGIAFDTCDRDMARRADAQFSSLAS
jgi:hypothetical protein